jgi:hypothetical protein
MVVESAPSTLGHTVVGIASGGLIVANEAAPLLLVAIDLETVKQPNQRCGSAAQGSTLPWSNPVQCDQQVGGTYAAMAALAKQNNDEAGSCTPNACTTRSSGLELMAASVAATIPPNTPHSTIALVDMAVMYTSTSAMTTRCDRV